MVLGDDDITVRIALLDDGVAFAYRDGRAGERSEADGHDADACVGRLLRRRDDVFRWLERLAVAEDDNRPITPALRRYEQVRALTNRARERAAGLADHGWIE